MLLWRSWGCGNSLLWESKAHIDDAMVHHGDIFFQDWSKAQIINKVINKSQ